MVHALAGRFLVTHPFHPRVGEQFDLIRYRRSFGHESVDGQDAAGRPITIPLSWTDAAAPDPWVAVAAGRSHFRVEDLLRLASLLVEVGR